MTLFKSYESQPSITFSGNGLPSVSTIGAKIDDVYLNFDTGESFRCHDDTVDNQIWHGDQGTLVTPPTLVDPGYADLAVMYTMDSVVGSTVFDAAGNYDGTVYNSSFATGLIGNALFQDNTVGARIEVPSVPGYQTGSLSFCCWFKGGTGGHRLGYSQNGSNRLILFRSAAGWIQSSVNDGSGSIGTSVTTLTDGVWYFIALVLDRDADLLHFYLNDNAPKTASVASLGTIPSSVLTIGSRSNLYADGDGYTDQFRYYTRALTAEEIGFIYNGGVAI